MRNNFNIDFLSHFGASVPVHQLRWPVRGVTMRHADRRYYQAKHGEAILQEFDGRSGYLYSIEMDIQAPMDIPIRTERPDLHILYLIAGTDPVHLLAADGAAICELAPERSCYLYLPAGNYILRMPAGWSNLFGFYFDGGIFRDGNEHEFPFLNTVLRHYRGLYPQAIASIDFWVGPQTRSAIQYLCRNLKKGVLSNEDFISRNLFRLIELSKKKVAMNLPYDVQASYVLAIRERITYELEDGNGIPSLELIASDIRISLHHLNTLHRETYNMSLRDYAKSVIAESAVDMLKTGMSVTEVSNHFNYSDSSAFARIIKSKTGKTPSEWIEEKSR